MRYDVLIRGGRIVSGRTSEQGDVGIQGDKILAVGDLSSDVGREEIDARHLIVMPGLIDSQVHFREPGLEHKEDIESGSRAALHGGVTSFLEMPNTHPVTTTAEALADKLARSQGRSWSNYGYFVGASPENIRELRGLERLPGTPGVKIFMGSSTGPLLVQDDEQLTEVLLSGRRRCPVHAEDEARNKERQSLLSPSPTAAEHPHIRDAKSAVIATRRILKLSAKTKRPVHILHVSTSEEPALIAEAKRAGLMTTAEVTPQHLWFAAPDCYKRLGSLAQMNPPIRDETHRSALWKALDEGVFDVFGSDHAPHTLEEKRRPYPASPSGMPGVQTMLPVLMTFVAQGKLSIETVVRMACEGPAELYGIVGKGYIHPGFSADVVLVDPLRSRVVESSMVQSKCGWSPYEGETLTGWPEIVILGGRIAIRSDERLGSPSGQMLRFR